MFNSNQGPVITESFVQTAKHGTKSDKFNHVTPADIGAALKDSGFSLVHLKTGRAKTEDRQDHQTTIARYRAQNPLAVTSGGRDLYMDLVFKVPHLYGALQAFVGTWRQICSNGLVVGVKYAVGRVAHVGDTSSNLTNLIQDMVAKHDFLVDQIREMQARNVTPNELAELARTVATLRLGTGANIQNIDYSALLTPRRTEDRGQDLFTVLNVIQENVMRHGLRYQSVSQNDQGETLVRNLTARPVARTSQGDTESIRSVDLNQTIWDAAAQLLKNAA
jgi:hypothetical protein